MEDLFELALVVIIAIIGGIAKSKNRKKKVSDRPTPAQVVEPIAEASVSDRKMINRRNIGNAVAAFSELLDTAEGLPEPEKVVVKPAIQPVREKTSIEAETAMKQRAELIQARVQESLSGEGIADAHGCIGGSMPVHTAEGESLAEHAKHERSRQQNLPQNAPAARAESLRRPSNQELRRAIVMSEVLNKPVSLRRR